jgi:DUF1365 family protein
MALTTGTAPLRSAIGMSAVRHRRHRPRSHRVQLGTLHVLVDVDELPDIDRRVAGFGYNRRAVMSIRDADHLASSSHASDVASQLPLRERVALLLADRGIELPRGRLQLLCHPRMFGHVFDPVAWWFAYHPDGRLGIVLAEVSNTFGDRVLYVLDDLEPGPNGTVRAVTDKRLHVSPFLPVQGLHYRFFIRAPGASPAGRALIHMEVRDDDGLILDATQRVELATFTVRRLMRALVRFPFVSLRSLGHIHAHALMIWLKRIPFHPRPAPPADALRVRQGRRTRRSQRGMT